LYHFLTGFFYLRDFRQSDKFTSFVKQQQLLKQEEDGITVSQILRTYGRHFRQIRKRYSDGHDGRCAVGIIMSYYGWNGIVGPNEPRRLLATIDELGSAGISKDQVVNLIKLNDSNMTFDEIADYLDRYSS
jgi:hypothetical protein